MTTCPSGVDYMHLIDHARASLEHTTRRPWADRLLRAALASILPYPKRFRAAAALGAWARPLAPLMRALPDFGAQFGARMAALLALSRPPARAIREAVRVAAPQRGRVAILEGCAQPALAPSINAAARRFLARCGVETIAAPDAGCCGALVHHMGREDAARAFARRNVDAWSRLIEDGGLDAIVVTTSGCGTTLKDYGRLLEHDPAYAAKAARIGALTKDISEYLATLDWTATTPRAIVLAYHAACSLQHGQTVTTAPKTLLRKAGYRVREPAESHICCGSAGVYNILQPALAGALRTRKLGHLERLKPDAIAAGNIGCLVQLAQGPAPVAHTIEWLDWACGGPAPAGLSHSVLAPRADGA